MGSTQEWPGLDELCPCRMQRFWRASFDPAPDDAESLEENIVEELPVEGSTNRNGRKRED